ncbi:MAG: 50S ribosomal protein L21 [Synergistaceae bacterium]|nr:50S ribosomal protein L21 [Synergistaceae bacterium]MBR1657166.1 50S ribosomal protein L21 [Synergistaceae bacterium]
MYAVIETGGKQYRVNSGDKFRIEKLSGETSTEIVFDKVLALGGEGTETKFGNPYISGARVTAEIVKQGRADKVLVFKYKSKKNIRKMRGHRQYFTEVVIRSIEA